MITPTIPLATQLETERESLAQNFAALEQKARALADWRRPIAAHPWATLATAAAAGALLAGVLKSRRRAARRAPDDARAPGHDGDAAMHPVIGQLATLAVEAATARALGWIEELAAPDEPTVTPDRRANGLPAVRPGVRP
ncbi:MAG: hypothetical protein HY275_07130 [Gemmatimonadetes bacterium]|nr:hypothetical protein [Gemmatimonadota bacterium]